MSAYKVSTLVLNILQAKFSKSKPMPFVISVKNMSQKTTLVVAVMGSARVDADSSRK